MRNWVKRLRRFGLSIAIITTLALPAGAVAGFGDVSQQDFFSRPVQWFADQGITSGTSPGCFSPSGPTSRAEAATFLYRMEGSPSVSAAGFDDVDPTSFYADAVSWMVGAGITTGTTASTFAPDRYLTRADIAVFLHRLAGTPTSSLSGFIDVASGSYYATAVGWMISSGITTGTTATTYEPNRAVTRGEVSTLMYRYSGSPVVTVSPDGTCTLNLSNLDLAEAESLRLLNSLRTGLGLVPLQRVDAMDTAARDWSQTMAATTFEHSDLPYWENIAWWSNQSLTPEQAAAQLHDMWINSPGHFSNMTKTDHRYAGIGFWQDANGWWGTHLFTK